VGYNHFGHSKGKQIVPHVLLENQGYGNRGRTSGKVNEILFLKVGKARGGINPFKRKGSKRSFSLRSGHKKNKKNKKKMDVYRG